MATEITTTDCQVYKLNPLNFGSLHFTVKASNDAHIALAATADGVSISIYEIFLGGWGNTKSSIRKDNEEPDEVIVDTPKILNNGEARGFWIKWVGGFIGVGKQGVEKPFMSWQDEESLNVFFYGVRSGWGSTCVWTIEAPPAASTGWNLDEPSSGPVHWGYDSNEQIPCGFDATFEQLYLLCNCYGTWVKANNGEIPVGALSSGHTEDGEPLFVGHGEHNGSLTVGKHPSVILDRSHGKLLKPKETVEHPLNSVVAYIMNMKCKSILVDYEELNNLNEIIYSLSEDESSVIHTRHKEFVKSMSLIILDCPITRTTVAGTIFAELLSKKILSMEAITQGIDDVLKYWNDFLMYYPQFFSYIAAIIAPLLLSQNTSFDFNNLKDSCTSIRPDNSSKLFTEVLYKMNSSKETQNVKEQLGGILWIYNKWNMLENVPLDVFMPNNQINKYFKKDQVGVFLLSIAMYDKIKLTDNKLLYDILQSWICTNISAEIIKSSLFARALTVAIVIVSLKLNHSYEDFFDHVHVKLLTHYIKLKPLPKNEIQAREVQCMFGIQIMSALLEHPRGMVLKLFNKLHQDRVISKESFEQFIQEYEKIDCVFR